MGTAQHVERPVAVVTGAASGLGSEVVKTLQRYGWAVAGFDIGHEAVSDLALVADVTDALSVRYAVDATIARFARIDGVVNCAGAFPSIPAPTHGVSVEVWNRILSVNLSGAFFIARETLRYLCESRGALVFVASIAESSPNPGSSPYAASKAGVLGLMRTISVEYGRFSVRANAVCPGWIDTPMAAPALRSERGRARIESEIPIGHVARPSEIAEIIEFLLSNRAAAITGAQIVADGGLQLTANVGDGEVNRLWTKFDNPSEVTGPLMEPNKG